MSHVKSTYVVMGDTVEVFNNVEEADFNAFKDEFNQYKQRAENDFNEFKQSVQT